jgi:signal transduction histidine kinase
MTPARWKTQVFKIDKEKNSLELSKEDDKTKLQLQLSEKMKNILFCSISHELRSPINHVNGILECLKQHVQDNYLLDFVNIGQSSIKMLTSKIDDILDYSLLETNTCSLKFEKFEIRKVLSEVHDIMMTQFDPKMINLSIFAADHVPQFVKHDWKRIKQILINLTFNALKYTEKGFVTLIVEWEYTDSCIDKFKKRKYGVENQEWLLYFAVSDSGCGIEKKRKMNLYQLFSNSRMRDYAIESDKDVHSSSQLMGMGLAYCHKMLTKMNSNLELTSAINIGSTFSFTLKVEYIANKINLFSSKHASIPEKIMESITPKSIIGSNKNVLECKDDSFNPFKRRVSRSSTNKLNSFMRPTLSGSNSKLVRITGMQLERNKTDVNDEKPYMRSKTEDNNKIDISNFSGQFWGPIQPEIVSESDPSEELK